MQAEREDVIELIRERIPELSQKKRAVAKYLVDHPVDSAFLTASELAQRVNVSEPTVVRLAVSLGFTGYPELRERLHHLVQGRLTTVDRLKEYHRHLESSEEPVAQALLMDLRNLEDMIRHLDMDSVNGLVEAILAAEKILIVGFRMSAVLAEFMRMTLRKSLDSEIVAVASSSDLFHEELVQSPAATLVVGIAFPRYTRRTVDYLRLAQASGFATAAMTDSDLSPLVEHADRVVLARYGILSYVDSFTAPLSMISAVATAVSLRRESVNLDRLKALEEMWQANRVFY